MVELEPEKTSRKISFFLHVLAGLITWYPSYTVLHTGIRPTQYYRQVSVLLSTRQVSFLHSTTDRYPSYSVLDSYPFYSVLDRYPSYTVLDRYPSYSVLDRYPSYTVLQTGIRLTQN